MGLFNAISEWKTAAYQKRVSEMQSQGKCPDCRGSGLTLLVLHEYFYMNQYNCPGCNGSGLFSDWDQPNN